MTRPVQNQRMFVAVYPPPAVQLELLEALTGRTLPPHRVTERDQVHLTLQFIGDVAVRELEAVKESVRRSAAGVGDFELRPLRLTTLPERGPARLVAVETDAPPALLEVQRRLRKRLARNAKERAAEGFLPHLTIARFTAPTPGFALAVPLACEPFAVHGISLMRSVLAPDGARHSEVEHVALE